ncbi:MAG: replicative DNA helicase [Kiritimatiellales bacterium]|nr:replicative DNA helicase [Kiritimatiellota bacterium]MBL7011778.1 replicative DNA helicase [Kiritimatiellales bacterium]
MSSVDQSGYRLPPYSEEAERGVLGSALIDSEKVLELCSDNQLSADSFHVPAHRHLFEQLQEMTQAGKAVDLLTVGEHLKQNGRLDSTGGYVFLEGLIDSTPTAAHAEYYIGFVRQKHLLRNIINEATSAIDRCYTETEEDAETILNRTESAFFDLSGQQISKTEDWKVAVSQTMAKIDGKQSYGVPTGYADLDKKLRGLHPTDMIVLAARPSMGKTSLAMNIAEHAALGKNKEHKPFAIGVFSLEMSQEQLVRRMLFSKARIPAWRDQIHNSDHAKLVSAADQLGKATIVVDDSAGLDVMDLCSRARRMKRLYKVDLIIIDYLQLLHDKRRMRDGRQQETASISNSIKKLAKDLNVPVLILSQLSRAPEQGGRDGKPRLSDLRDSGAIEQDADVVLLLTRPSFNDAHKGDVDEDDPLAEVIIAKHRNGPTGNVEMNFFKEFTRFEDRDARHVADEME